MIKMGLDDERHMNRHIDLLVLDLSGVISSMHVFRVGISIYLGTTELKVAPAHSCLYGSYFADCLIRWYIINSDADIIKHSEAGANSWFTGPCSGWVAARLFSASIFMGQAQSPSNNHCTEECSPNSDPRICHGQ